MTQNMTATQSVKFTYQRVKSERYDYFYGMVVFYDEVCVNDYTFPKQLSICYLTIVQEECLWVCYYSKP